MCATYFIERSTSSFRVIQTNFQTNSCDPSGYHVFSDLGNRQFLGDFRESNHLVSAHAVRKFPFPEPTRTVNYFSHTTSVLDGSLRSHPSRRNASEVARH